MRGGDEQVECDLSREYTERAKIFERLSDAVAESPLRGDKI